MRTEACLRGQYSVCLRRFKASPDLLCAKGIEWEGAGMAVMMVKLMLSWARAAVLRSDHILEAL